MLADLPVGSIIKLSLLLVVVIIIGWVTVWQVRRRLQSPDETSGAGFTLSDLRQLHKSGQMSDEEFDRAKARVVDAAKRAAERDKDKAAAGAGGVGGRSLKGPPDGIQRPPRDGAGGP